MATTRIRFKTAPADITIIVTNFPKAAITPPPFRGEDPRPSVEMEGDEADTLFIEVILEAHVDEVKIVS